MPAELRGTGDTDTVDIQKLGGVMEPQKRYTFHELRELCAEHGLFERFTDLESPCESDRKMRATFSKILRKYDQMTVSSGVTFCAEGAGRGRGYVTRTNAV